MTKRTKQNTSASQIGKRHSGIIEIEEAQKRRKQKRKEEISEERLEKRREKNLKKSPRAKMSRGKMLSAVGVVAVSFLLLGVSGMQLFDLTKEKARVEGIYQEKQIEKEALEKEYAMVNDPEYIEAQARERFHMLKEGEILYVFPPKESDNSQ